MNKLKNRLLFLGMSAVMMFSCGVGFASCGGGEGSGDISSEQPFEEEEDLPTTYADKSKLAYVSSLDGYKKTDWTAKWIWSSTTQKNNYTAFRKSFTLDEKPAKATACIAVENEYYLWVNGELVVYDGGYKRGPTMVDTYYEEIDLAPYLKKGDNVVVILAHYYGRGGTASATSGAAGLLFELDCGGKKIASDKSFKTMRLTAYKNDRLLKEDYPNYDQASALAEWNCYYDARDSVGDFTAVNYDDSAWSKATVIANFGTEPFNDTYRCVAPFFAFDKEYTLFENAAQYLGKKFTKDTVIDIDMGTNTQFSPYFELEAEKDGLRITYYTDSYSTSGTGSFKDDYVTVKGKQSYESYPWRTGKHLIIEVPAGVTFIKIGARRNGYATKTVGVFTSSDHELTTLWQRAVNTTKICMRDTFMDCPERERSPWSGDVANMVAQAVYALDDNAGALIQKTILGTVGWTQSGTGTAVDDVIPLRVPCNKVTEWAAQDLAYFNSVYEYYMHSGDGETVKLFYPIAKKYLNLWTMQENGVIKFRGSDSTWADWGDGFIDTEVIQVCQYYMALNDALTWAKDFNKTEDVEFYRSRIESIKNSFRKVYLKDGGFTSSEKGEYDDRANAMAVVSGLAEADDYAKVLNVLKTTYNCSVYMERYVEEALCIMGEYDVCTARTKARYATMLASDYDTLWEHFDIDIANNMAGGSPNHGWAGGPLIMLSKYYAGIRPTSAGFASYEIVPQGALNNFTCEVPTPNGTIKVSLEKNASGAEVKVTAVKGNGTVKIPVSLGENIAVTGGTAKFEGVQNGYSVYSVNAGTYTFTVK